MSWCRVGEGVLERIRMVRDWLVIEDLVNRVKEFEFYFKGKGEFVEGF